MMSYPYVTHMLPNILMLPICYITCIAIIYVGVDIYTCFGPCVCWFSAVESGVGGGVHRFELFVVVGIVEPSPRL